MRKCYVTLVQLRIVYYGYIGNSGRCVKTTIFASFAWRSRSALIHASWVSRYWRADGDVVDRDEVNALVVEAVIGFAEEFLPCLAAVERGVVLRPA
jgi:hypothetical protein